MANAAKDKKAEQKKPADRSEAKSKEKPKEEKKGIGTKRMIAIAALLIIIVAVIAFVVLSNSLLTVPFSTFKSNFNAAQHVAVIGTYGNQTQYAYVAQCSIQLIQTIVHSRNVSFFLINQTLCTYQKGSLGNISIESDTPSDCLVNASSYPTVFLNYSETNSTVITLDKIYVYGDKAYMSQCPIAVDLS